MLLLLSVALAAPLPPYPVQAGPSPHDCDYSAPWAGGHGWILPEGISEPSCDLVGLPPTRASQLRKVEIWADGCRQRFAIEVASCGGRLDQCATDTDEARAAALACHDAAAGDSRRQWFRGAAVGAGAGSLLTLVAVVAIAIL